MRRTPEGVEVLRGCMHLTTTSAGTESVEVESEADWALVELVPVT